MKRDIYSEIGKYLAGELPENRVDELHRWINSSRENQELYDEICEFWKETRIKEDLNNSESVFEKILDGINTEGISPVTKHNIDEKSGSRNVWYYTKIAAAVLIVALCGASLWYLNKNDFFSPKKEPTVEFVHKINLPGQKSKIYLPDGSIAVLNAGSKLGYYSEFSDTARDVYLSGEAFFEVTKNHNKPFRVHGNNISVTALGTAFNFSAYEDNAYSQVALLEGRLKIESGSSWEIMEEGEVLEHEKSENTFTKYKEDVSEFIAWKDGILIFNEDNFKDIKERLERWYGVNINVTGTPNNHFKFYGRFDNEYLSNVLESMRYGNDFEYKIDGKKVQINFK